jgi:hypothetical protein
MAIYENKDYLTTYEQAFDGQDGSAFFSEVHKTGDYISMGGIYRCCACGYEAAHQGRSAFTMTEFTGHPHKEWQAVVIPHGW